MSLLNDASLILVPSAIKTGEVLVQKPLPNKFADETGNYDGNDPQTNANLTFTRASNASRVNADGLVEKVRTNLITYSEQFDNAAWVKANLSITANTTTAPDGTTTAETLTTTGAGQCQLIQSYSFSTGVYSGSVYVKKGTLNGLYIELGNSYAFFNINDGTLGSGGQFSTGWLYYNHTIEDAGNGWYRCTLIGECTIATSYNYRAAQPTSGIGSYNSGAIGATTFLWGAQLEVSDFGPTDYIATTTAAVSVGPVANLPRLDYLGSSCPRLLLEPQRTNLVLYSEQFDNAAWTKSNATITANAATSPDGYTNADKLVENSVNGNHFIYRSQSTFTPSANYWHSWYVKAGERYKVRIQDAADSDFFAAYNLNTGSLIDEGTNTMGNTTITPLLNGWYRLTLASNQATTARYPCIILLPDNYTAGDGISYQGNGTSGVFIWGAQLEAGAYATSYVGPTLGAAVTRLADACSKTGISSLIGQTEGTFFVEANVPNGYDGNNLFITASDGTSANMIFINRVAGKAEYRISAGGVQQAAFAMPTVLSTGVHKLAIAYKANDFAFYVDGVLVHSDTSGSVPACSLVNVGSYIANALPYNDGISQALLFKTRLSNAKLAELTTL